MNNSNNKKITHYAHKHRKSLRERKKFNRDLKIPEKLWRWFFRDSTNRQSVPRVWYSEGAHDEWSSKKMLRSVHNGVSYSKTHSIVPSGRKNCKRGIPMRCIQLNENSETINYEGVVSFAESRRLILLRVYTIN